VAECVVIVANGSTTLREFWVRKDGPRLGYSREMIRRDGEEYMERRILWLGLCTLRLHKFLSGDRAEPHDHPFWFVTFPLTTYRERVLVADGMTPVIEEYSEVRRFRFHFRPARHAHSVYGDGRPIWTLVITGRRTRKWGFWVDDCTRWIPYDEMGVEYDRHRKEYET
jgi:hypothetical protein